MLLELDLSKREVLHLLAPLVSSYAFGFMTYHHIRDVASFRGYTLYFHMPRQKKKKDLWCQAYVIRTRPKQAWGAASFGSIGFFIRFWVHDLSSYSWRCSLKGLYIIFSHAKAKKKKFFGVRPMLLELNLSKREVLHLLAPLVSSYAFGFMTYHHIRDVVAWRGYTLYFHMPRQKKNSLVSGLCY
jgi:hypothetical protein